MQLFYIPREDNNIIGGDEFKHCIKVLRKKKNDKILFTDGEGNLYSSHIDKINEHYCNLNKIKKIKSVEKTIELEVAISLIKSQSRLEWMVEKLSEIGVCSISFVITRYSERKKLKYQRLIKKTISALKQCKSLFLTELNETVSFDNFIRQHRDTDNKFYADIDYNKKFNSSLKGKKNLLVIGPEGDFSENEKELMSDNGFKKISLGNNILRTETAAVVGGYLLKNL